MPPALRGPLLGALLGFPILGGGGRLAMHAIALTPGAQRSVTVQGTITVLLAGLAAGVAGGAIYALLAWVLPARRLLRAALFAVILALLTLRGLHPVQPLTLALFLPIVLLFGWLLERSWHTRSRFTRAIHTSP
jgi:hypothetical protein